MNITEELRGLMGPLDPAATRLVPEPLPAQEVLRRATTPTRPGRSWQRRWVAIGAIAALAAGSAAAAQLLTSAPSTVENMVRCYSVAELTNDPTKFTDTAMASRPGEAQPGISATVSQAIEACAFLWRVGLLRPEGVSTAIADDGTYPAPALAACVLSSGEAAVLPGTDETCGVLGLAPLADRK